jgi:hypothetical protein
MREHAVELLTAFVAVITGAANETSILPMVQRIARVTSGCKMSRVRRGGSRD